MTLEELEIKFTAQTSGLSSQLNAVKQQLGGVENTTVKAQSAFSKFAKAGALIGGAMIGRELLQVGKEALQMANDAVESESLFEVSMGTMAESTRAWSEDLSKSLGLNAYEVRKSAGTFNVMFDAMGIGAEKAQDMSQELTALAQDMASFYNLSPDEAFTKLSAGMTGEMEGLKRLGILVDEATVSQFAYENGIAETGKSLTQQQKVLARYGTIMKQTSKAQGDLARTAESPANQLRRMTAQVDAAKIALGTALQPALLAIIPVLTSMAIGAGNVIKSLQGVGKGNEDSFNEIALTIDEARELVKASVDTSTIELVDKIEVLDQKVNAALTDYMTAEKAVKKVQIGIELDPPTTTGKERITTALDDLKALVPTTLDIKPLTTKLDVITEDGEITAKDEKAMERTLNLWSAKEIKKIKIDANNKTKAIDAQIKSGEITEAEGSNLKQAVTDAATEAIGAVTATVTTIKVEVAAGAASLATVSFTPGQAIELGTALSKAVNAQEIAVSAEVDKVEATWAGDGAIGDTVTGIYTDVQVAFVKKNAELKAIAEKMLTGVSTAKMWDDAIRIKEEIRQITAFMFESNEKYGAIFNRDFYANGMFASTESIFTAINEQLVAEADSSKKLLEEKIGDIMSLPPDIFNKNFPGKTPADIITKLRTDAEKELSSQYSGTITKLAKSFMPGIAAAIASGDISGAQESVANFLKGLDFSKLDEAGRLAALDMISQFDLSPMGTVLEEQLLGLENLILESSPDISGAFGDLATEAMDDLLEGLKDKSLRKEDYDRIIGASSSKEAMAKLASDMYGEGKTATADMIRGLLEQVFGVKEAARLIANAAKPPEIDTYGTGANFAQGFINGIKGKNEAARQAAADLADVAWNSLKNRNVTKSPAKRPMKTGEYFSEGFAVGILNQANKASSAASVLADSAMGALSGMSVAGPSMSTGSLSGTSSQGRDASLIASAVSQVLSKLDLKVIVGEDTLGRISIKAINGVQQRTGRKLVTT